MNVELLSGALGAEISGIDLKDTSLENFKKINSRVQENHRKPIKLSWRGARKF